MSLSPNIALLCTNARRRNTGAARAFGTRSLRRRRIAPFLLLSLVACGDSSELIDGGATPDSPPEMRDGAMPDAADADSPDAANAFDGAALDAPASDVSLDAPEPDGGVDSGTDTGATDTGVTDTGVTDTGADSGCGQAPCNTPRVWSAPRVHTALQRIDRGFSVAINDRGDKLIAFIENSTVSAHHYDSAAMTWSTSVLETLPWNPRLVQAAVSSSGHMVVAWKNNTTADGLSRVNSVVYDPAVRTWSAPRAHPNPVTGIWTKIKVGVDGSGNVFVVATDDDFAVSWSRYDSASGTWEESSFSNVSERIINLFLHVWDGGRATVVTTQRSAISRHHFGPDGSWETSTTPLAHTDFAYAAANEDGRLAILAKHPGGNYTLSRFDALNVAQATAEFPLPGDAYPIDSLGLSRDGTTEIYFVTPARAAGPRQCEPTIEVRTFPWTAASIVTSPSFVVDRGTDFWERYGFTEAFPWGCNQLLLLTNYDDAGGWHSLVFNDSLPVGLRGATEPAAPGMISMFGSSLAMPMSIVQVEEGHRPVDVDYEAAFSPSGNAIFAWMEDERTGRDIVHYSFER